MLKHKVFVNICEDMTIYCFVTILGYVVRSIEKVTNEHDLVSFYLDLTSNFLMCEQLNCFVPPQDQRTHHKPT